MSESADPTYRLVDEERRIETRISQSDPEFLARYFDLNIVEVTSDPDPAALEHMRAG